MSLPGDSEKRALGGPSDPLRPGVGDGDRLTEKPRILTAEEGGEGEELTACDGGKE